ncbi:unnamed protein product [Heligmosomoides polygyrus]|uniref:Uncharacterized protein n=1 Tax=Heligmosomoides polygyrus TaxID=6339 RepID=A0A3P7Y5J0_HELPZ|nr:unnamed protein product [Heligmosomoides polygyrus]
MCIPCTRRGPIWSTRTRRTFLISWRRTANGTSRGSLRRPSRPVRTTRSEAPLLLACCIGRVV